MKLFECGFLHWDTHGCVLRHFTKVENFQKKFSVEHRENAHTGN